MNDREIIDMTKKLPSGHNIGGGAKDAKSINKNLTKTKSYGTQTYNNLHRT
jgi:hypothetical protein